MACGAAKLYLSYWHIYHSVAGRAWCGRTMLWPHAVVTQDTEKEPVITPAPNPHGRLRAAPHLALRACATYGLHAHSRQLKPSREKIWYAAWMFALALYGDWLAYDVPSHVLVPRIWKTPIAWAPATGVGL